MDDDFLRMYKEMAEKDCGINDLTVKEFAEATENNHLWRQSIWIKAYHMEDQLEEVKAMLIKRVDPAKILEAMNK